MVRLTKKAAEELLRRELDVSRGSVGKPADMNGDPRHPYFEAKIGKLTATVRLRQIEQSVFIELGLSFYDGHGTMTRYFYADDEYKNYLEECENLNTASDLEAHLDWMKESADETATVRELAEETERKARYLRKLEGV